MMISPSRRVQRGATLVVGLIMLVLLTLVVTTAFMMSSGNLKAVGNMQFRDEAIAAANVAIEQIIGSNFTTLPIAANIAVDIDQDGTDDYTVAVAAPVCMQAVPVGGTLATLSGVTSGVPSTTDYNTIWDIRAQVGSLSTGASAVVRQGIRRRLTEPQFLSSVCNV
jgi:type II secretory pathway pseudopilin PulG